MKRSIFLIISIVLIAASTINAQSYIDPDMLVEARVFSYEMTEVPVIDGIGDEWSDIPWTEVRYNDRDHNGDLLIDPNSSRIDYRVNWKSAWVNGSNKIYFIFEILDDQMYTADSVRASHRDNLSIRLDPYDEEIEGEPMDSETKNSFSIRFQTDNAENTGYEGNESVKPAYVANVTVYDDEFPIRSVMEVELTLPENLPLSEGYVMGYYPLFADNDPEDDSYNTKNTVPMQWPQMYSLLGSSEYKFADNKLYPDVFWRNDFWWGNLECVSPTVHEVASGGSIQSAIDAASYGDIIKVAAGEFTENLVVNMPQIRIVGTITDSDTTKLMAADANSPILKIADDDAAYGVVVENLAFDGWVDGAAGGTGIEVGSAQAEILGNYFTGLSNPVVKSATTGETKAYACVIEDNNVYASDGGLELNTPSTIFRYNTVKENTGSYGIVAKGLSADNYIDIAFNTVFNHRGECAVGYGGSGVFTVHHNMFTRSEQLYGSGDTSGDDGIENQDEGGSTDYIYNNTIVGWKSDGIQMGNGSTNFNVRNNLIAYCSSKDYDIRTVGSTDIDYGLSFSNGSDDITTLGTVAITSDPMFTDQLEDDYTITESSPAVDAGETEPFGFKVMYAGEGLDIGASETGLGVITSVKSVNTNVIPEDYTLAQNYPNPFNPSTIINFTVPSTGVVELSVYNILGQKVATLVNKELSAGSYQYNFDASKLSSGIYVYSIKANNFSATKKMMLLK